MEAAHKKNVNKWDIPGNFWTGSEMISSGYSE